MAAARLAAAAACAAAMRARSAAWNAARAENDVRLDDLQVGESANDRATRIEGTRTPGSARMSQASAGAGWAERPAPTRAGA